MNRQAIKAQRYGPLQKPTVGADTYFVACSLGRRQPEFRYAAVITSTTSDGNAAIEIEGHRLIEVFATWQPAQVLRQEANIRLAQFQRRAGLAR